MNWPRRVPVFDQKSLGSCTGNAAAGWLATDSQNRTGLTALPDGTPVDETLAIALYSEATQLDSDPANYPPTDTGSSGLAAAKALKNRGLADSYAHAFTPHAAYSALQSGPGMAGTVWYASMFDTAADGHIHVDAKSGVAGGHEYCVFRLDVDPDGTVSKVWIANSWGDSWGVQGHGYFTGSEFAALLADQGDFVAPIAVGPTPVPVPAPMPAPVPAPAPAPTPVGDAFTLAVASYKGLDTYLARLAKSHQVNGQPMTAAQYAAWRLAGTAHLR